MNVSGGLRFQSCPKEDLLVAAFRQFGAQSRVPSLWVYAKNDSYFPPELVDRMQSAFLDGGGDVKLVMLDPDERFDGHFIFGLTEARAKWLPQMDAFLRFHKLPTWTRDDVNALLQEAQRQGDIARLRRGLSGGALRARAGAAEIRHLYVDDLRVTIAAGCAQECGRELREARPALRGHHGQ